MDSKIDTVREALDFAYDFKATDTHTLTYLAYSEWRDSFLSELSKALSPIDPEAIKRECVAKGKAEWFRDTKTISWSRIERALAASPAEAAPVKKRQPYNDADELRGYIDAAGMFIYAPLAGDPCPHCGKTLINVSRYQDDPDWFPYCPHCERRSDVDYKDYSYGKDH